MTWAPPPSARPGRGWRSPATTGGNRVFPAFQGCSGGPSGGPLFTLQGREVDIFITPEGVHPGAVLEVGDTFSFAGAVWPNLDSRVWITATSPSGVQHVIQGRADKYGYFYNPDGDFVVDEPGRWTVDVHPVQDTVVPSTGLPPTCHNTGDLLGSREGQFTIYVVERDAPPLALDLEAGELTIEGDTYSTELRTRLRAALPLHLRPVAAAPGLPEPVGGGARLRPEYWTTSTARTPCSTT